MGGKKALGALLALTLVAGFAGFVAMHAVEARLVDQSYYQEALADSHVYDRLYDDLLMDPAFAPQVDALLGGIDVPRDKVVVTLKELIKPEYLRTIVDAIVGQLVGYLKDGQKLDLTLDITPIVQGLHDFAINATTELLKQLPVQEAASGEEFVAEFQKVLAVLGQDGMPPSAIPSFPIPPEDHETVIGLLMQSTKLEPGSQDYESIAGAMREQLGQNNVANAIRMAALVTIEGLIQDKIREISENRFVRKLENETGVHLMFGPTPAQNAKLESKLEIIQSLDATATWLRPVCAAVVVLSALGLFFLFRDDRRRRLLWPGSALLIAGAAGFLAWAAARGTIVERAVDLVDSQASGLPPSLQKIMKDVAEKSIDGVGTAIVIPALGIIVVGIVLMVLARRAGKQAARAGGALPPVVPTPTA
ncbi:MAG: hypothetical protein IT370_07445 [Deltaproteobacteria bacterium]|nr:hypothetical protein [Deltaproteobacteria bacterium]